MRFAKPLLRAHPAAALERLLGVRAVPLDALARETETGMR